MSESDMPSNSSAGSWDETGMLNSFKKKGITYFSAISEYLGNSVDAGATRIKLEFTPKSPYNFLVLDNGCGMTNEEINYMFSNYRANHNQDTSIGSVGIGAKLGNAFLSQYHYDSYIYTKSQMGPYLKVEIPWSKIFQDGKFTGQIKVSNMSFPEIEYFKNQITDLGSPESPGTIIAHQIDNLQDTDLYQEVRLQFDRTRLKRTYTEKRKRWDCMFTQPNLEIYLSDYYLEDNHRVFLERYDHLSESLDYYYPGRKQYQIQVFQNDKKDFLFVTEEEGEELTIVRKGKGYSKTLSEYNSYTYHEYIDTGLVIQYHLGGEINPEYFNPDNPSRDNLTRSLLSPYDKQFFQANSKDQRIDCSKTSIIRNSQQISSINLPEINFSKQDGGMGTERMTLEVVVIKDLIVYDTTSGQNNLLDEIFGVQEIKDNIEEKKIRPDLLKMMAALRKNYSQQTYNYMEGLLPDVIQPDICPITFKFQNYQNKIQKMILEMKKKELSTPLIESQFQMLVNQIQEYVDSI